MEKVLDELFAILDENPNKNHDFYDGLSLDEAINLAIVINDSGIFYKKNGKLKKRFRFVLTTEESRALQKIMLESKRKRLERKGIAKGGISYLGKKNKQDSG